MQIMVAQYHDYRILQAHDEPQYRQRPRAPVDDIPDQPEPVFFVIELNQVEKLPEFLITALQITNCESGHSSRAIVNSGELIQSSVLYATHPFNKIRATRNSPIALLQLFS